MGGDGDAYSPPGFGNVGAEGAIAPPLRTYSMGVVCVARLAQLIFLLVFLCLSCKFDGAVAALAFIEVIVIN